MIWAGVGFVVLAFLAASHADASKPNTPGEPMATKLSPAKSAEFLDAVALGWTQRPHCGTCLTNYPYPMARPFLKDSSLAHAEWRKFFEQRAAGWQRGK